MAHVRKLEKAAGAKFGVDQQPAARVGALGREVLDARHDGHDPQPRPERRGRRGPEGADRATAGSPTTATAASSRCSATSSSRFRRTKFEHEFEAVKHAHGAKVDTDLDEAGAAGDRRALQDARQGRRRASRSRRIRWTQLRGARDAVFRSWNNPRAMEYRRIYDIPDHIGTAVNVQMMVFGNTGDRSAHRRRLHAQPGDRREGVLRRVPRQRPGRGRRRRHPHAAADRRARAGDAEGLQGAAARSRRGSRSTTRTSRTSSSRSRTRSSTCCRRAAASAPATRRS